MERKEVSFRIQRYNPQVDRAPFYDNFKIMVEKGITILRALSHIKEQLEPRLTFRAFCQAGICGSCALRINGVSRLACTTQVWDVMHGDNPILVEPLNNLPVIRDLLVDIDPLINKLHQSRGWVVPSIPETQMGCREHTVSEEEFEVINAATDCVLCASCYSECSMSKVNPNYISPPVLLKTFRMNNDTRDCHSADRLKVISADHGLWDCTHCYRCVEHCVKNIPIMDGIHRLREETFERKLEKTAGSRHAQAFFDDIRESGRLNEMSLPIRTRGIFGCLGMLPMTLRMAAKKRTPPLFAHRIRKFKQVRELYRKLVRHSDGKQAAEQ